jgi:hypothetical protein
MITPQIAGKSEENEKVLKKTAPATIRTITKIPPPSRANAIFFEDAAAAVREAETRELTPVIRRTAGRIFSGLRTPAWTGIAKTARRTMHEIMAAAVFFSAATPALFETFEAFTAVVGKM